MKKMIFPLIFASLFCFIVSGTALSADKALTLRLGHTGPVGSGLDIGLNNIAKDVNKKTDGAIAIQVYPQGQLGSEIVMLDSATSGTLDITTPSTPILANIIPEFSALSLPFLFDDNVEFFDIVSSDEFINKTNMFFKGKNLVLVSYLDAMMRGLSNTKRDVRSPGDLKGLKIRVMAGPIYTDIFTSMGATTSTIPFTELYSALQQGVVDGEDNNLYVMNIMKFMEVQKYHTVLNHTVQCNAFMVNDKVWNNLSSDQQRIFKESINNHINVYLDMLRKNNEDAEEAAKENGVSIVKLSKDELQAFRNAVKPVYAKYKEVIGADFYNYIMDKIEAHRK